MSDLWKQYEGQLVDNQFPLLQFLGNTNHSAVFLTKLDQAEPSKVAIKFISADIPAPDQQLATWSQAAKLDHPQLLRIFNNGRCRLGGMNLLYVVMEHADENLSQFLPLRPLNAEETRDVLNPLVDALVYLHGKGFAHCHVKPSNLLALADHLKLSGDTILPIGESRELYRDRDTYDAPESFSSSTFTASTADDVWSLGVTLVETLTQHAPPLPFDDTLDPVVPDTLPPPFLDIARYALLRDPSRRWTISQIAAQLNPALVAVAANASASAASHPLPAVTSAPPVLASIPAPAPVPVSTAIPPAVHASPLSIPLASEPAIPLAKLPVGKRPDPHYVASPHYQNELYPDKKRGLPKFVIPVVLGALVLLGAYFLLPKLFNPAPESSVSSASSPDASSSSSAGPAVTTPAPSSTNKAAVDAPTSSAAALPTKSAPDNRKKSTEPVRAPESAKPKETVNPPVDTADKSPTPVAAESAEKTSAPAGGGDVLDQVLPKPSASALGTIHGVVKVVVRAKVDAAGNVSSAALDAAGPSKYFADQSLRAAEKWKFASPAADGHSVPSEWLIRFEFTHSGVNAVPTQIPR